MSEEIPANVPWRDPNEPILEKQDYYHGFRPRKDVEYLLKQPGDFLLRKTDAKATGGEALLVLSVLSEDKRLLNHALTFEDYLWQLNIVSEIRERRRNSQNVANNRKNRFPGFGTVVELVEHYKTHRIPGKAYLRHAIPRPVWLISQDKVEYKTQDMVGSGNFGYVYRGIYHRTDKDKLDVAVKVCRGGLKESAEMNEATKEFSHLMHANIVQMFGVVKDHLLVTILTEFCVGGNLETHLKKIGDRLAPGEALIYAVEICDGMHYLHDVGCIHMNLCARNVLISSGGVMKISDYGLSKMIEGFKSKPEGEKKDDPSLQIPLRWMAPECLQKKMQFSKKSDVWSYGVVLYEVFNKGMKPWPEEPPNKIAAMIRKAEMPEFPDGTPRGIVSLAKKIWVIKPDDRPSVRRIQDDLEYLATLRFQIHPDLTNWSINTIPGVKRNHIDDIRIAIEKDVSWVDPAILDGLMPKRTN